MKCVVGSLLQEKGLSWTNIATKLVALCLDGISVSQGVKSSVMKHIWKTCAPFSLGVHYVFKKKHLDVHTLFSFPFMHQVETLLQSSYQYFCKSSKCHLEFTKLATIMETKGPKLLRNVKTKWISMLSLSKWVIAKYKTLLMKMAINMDANSQATTKFEHWLIWTCYCPYFVSSHSWNLCITWLNFLNTMTFFFVILWMQWKSIRHNYIIILFILPQSFKWMHSRNTMLEML
jgi:hypothetical protein